MFYEYTVKGWHPVIENGMQEEARGSGSATEICSSNPDGGEILRNGWKIVGWRARGRRVGFLAQEHRSLATTWIEQTGQDSGEKVRAEMEEGFSLLKERAAAPFPPRKGACVSQ